MEFVDSILSGDLVSPIWSARGSLTRVSLFVASAASNLNKATGLWWTLWRNKLFSRDFCAHESACACVGFSVGCSLYYFPFSVFHNAWVTDLAAPSFGN